MTTNTQREFWVRKDPEQEWQTLKVSHPDYTDAVRIAANTFREQTFGGEVYLPAPMQLKEPENAEDLKNTASVTFPRAVIGDAATRLWRQVSDSGRLKPFNTSASLNSGVTASLHLPIPIAISLLAVGLCFLYVFQPLSVVIL